MAAVAPSPTATTSSSYGTTQLCLASGNGPVYRTISLAPPRDALPSEIPIIDVSAISNRSPSATTTLQDRKALAAKVRDAATNNGFFYITNHGISPQIYNDARDAVLEFFHQPAEQKLKANSNQSQFFNGYKPPATQRVNPSESVDNRESFSWQYDYRYDPSVSSSSSSKKIPPQVLELLRCEDFQWEATAHLTNFKPSVVAYWRACLELARALVGIFALSLDLPEEFFAEKFSHPDANLSFQFYPPMMEEEDNNNNKRVDGGDKETTTTQVSIGSHTDFQLFTILWQDQNGGLQVLNNETNEWMYAKPVEDTFVVNIADYLQRITNDRYRSTVHRAQNRSGKERISMPFFFGFNLNESCGVLDSCVDKGKGEGKKYDEISCVDWVRRRARAMHIIKEPNPPDRAEG